MVGIKKVTKINTMDNMYVYCVIAFYTETSKQDYRGAHIAHTIYGETKILYNVDIIHWTKL